MTDKIIEELEELIKVCEKRIPNYEEACKDIMGCFKLNSDDGENTDKYNLKTYQIAESYHAKANDLICQIDSYNKAIEIVKKYDNDGWINVKDRLPNYGTRILVTFITDKGSAGIEDCWYSSINRCFKTYKDFEKVPTCIKILAWQPLPQPYKGE